MKPKQEGDENAELPIAVRANASWRRRRHWHRTRYRNIRYDARFADGREELDIEIDAVLHGWRYPADAWRVRTDAKRECPEGRTGPWADYPLRAAALSQQVGEARTWKPRGRMREARNMSRNTVEIPPESTAGGRPHRPAGRNDIRMASRPGGAAAFPGESPAFGVRRHAPVSP